MTLLSKLATIETSPAHQSRVDTLIASLSDEEGALLRKLLLDRRVSVMSIYNALRSEGHAISRDTLTRYRNEHSE